MVGDNIRHLRLERKMTQEQLATASAMDRSVLIGVETGRRGTVFERLFDIADALDVPVVELLKEA